MSLRRTSTIALVAALTVSLAGLPAAPSFAAPSSAQTAADRARVDAAIAKLDAARKRAADIDARVEKALAGLDAVIAEEERLRGLLDARVVSMYRSGEDGSLTMLLTAETVEDFTSRWDLLVRMSIQDASDLEALEVARAKAESSAEALLPLQAEQARAADAAAAEVAAARKALADSTAALKDYDARIARAARQAAAKAKAAAAARARLTGSGPWLTGGASHYSRNFTGRGASGARINPYSMMVAHKTLPFHTLLEIEYNGKRAVASVEDRGPYVKGRVFDLGPGVVRVLGFNGVHDVKYRVITQR